MKKENSMESNALNGGNRNRQKGINITKARQVPIWKRKEVDALAELVNRHATVGLVDMRNMPSPDLRKLKNFLKGKAIIKMSKKSLLQRALEKTKAKELVQHLQGQSLQPALIVSNLELFEIAKFLRMAKRNAPPKVNATMQEDIVVQAGETPFTPGPILAELQSFGIKAGTEKGKIVIKSDAVLAKKGEKISKKKADIIAKLGITPIVIGIDMVAAKAGELLFSQELLSITPEKVLASLKECYTKAFNLAFNSGYPTERTVKLFVQKAFRSAKVVALAAKYECSLTIKEILAEAHSKAMALKSHVKEKVEAPVVEQKSEEQKAETQAAN